MRYRISMEMDGPIGSVIDAIERADPGIPVNVEVVRAEASAAPTALSPHRTRAGAKNQTRVHQRVPMLTLSTMQGRPGDKWTVAEVGAVLALAGYAASSASASLSCLDREGFIERTGRSLYLLTDKGRNAAVKTA